MKPATAERASRETVAGRPYRRRNSAVEREAIAQRRAVVARLHPTMSISEIAQTEIAREHGWSRARIGDDVQKLVAAGVLQPRPRGRVPGTKLSNESCQKIAAAKRGKPRPDVTSYLSSLHGNRAEHRSRMLRAIEGRKRHNVKPNTLSRWKGRVEGLKAGRQGGKRAVEDLYPEKARKALRLRAEKTPIRKIADLTGLTKREVEGVIARSRLSP